MYRPGALSTFTVLCTHQPPFPELSRHPKEKPVPMKQWLPIPARHPCESLFNPRLYELAALDPSGEWHQAPRPLVCPVTLGIAVYPSGERHQAPRPLVRPVTLGITVSKSTYAAASVPSTFNFAAFPMFPSSLSLFQW